MVFWTSYLGICRALPAPTSVFIVLEGYCLDCSGWVLVILLQLTCFSFLISYLSEVLITNIFCRHTSRGICLPLQSRLWFSDGWVSCTCAHINTQHSSSTASLKAVRQREIPTQEHASDLVSWAGPLPVTSKLEDVFQHELLLPVLLDVLVMLPGMAQTHYSEALPLTFFSLLPHRLQDR